MRLLLTQKGIAPLFIIIGVILGIAGGAYYLGTTKNNKFDQAPPVATPSVIISGSPTPSATITPTITSKPKIKTESTPTPTPVVETQSNELPQVTGIQKPKSDSTVDIEKCKTYAKEKRKEEERKVNEEYSRTEPKVVELAASQNNAQTEAMALKYGIIKESDIQNREKVFSQLLQQYPNSPVDHLASVADSIGSSYWTYIRSLHDWAVGELNKWNVALKDKFDTYENQVYQACLSAL